MLKRETTGYKKGKIVSKGDNFELVVYVSMCVFVIDDSVCY